MWHAEIKNRGEDKAGAYRKSVRAERELKRRGDGRAATGGSGRRRAAGLGLRAGRVRGGTGRRGVGEGGAASRCSTPPPPAARIDPARAAALGCSRCSTRRHALAPAPTPARPRYPLHISPQCCRLTLT